MIGILVALVILGALIYIVGLLPIDATVKTIIKVIAIVFVFLYVLQLLGLWSGLPRVR